MEYAYRTRDAFMELDPGDVGIWQLPPMTPGVILLKSFYAMPPGWSGTGTSARSAHVNPIGAGRGAAVARGALAGMGSTDAMGTTDIGPKVTGTTPGTIARDNRPWQPGGIGGELEIGDIGGSYGPTMELALELLRTGTTVDSGLNHIFHDTPNSGDIWAVKVTRKVDGSLDRRRYRLQVAYPSVLPLETRRVPTSFLNNGFDANWNDRVNNDDSPYLLWFQLRDNILGYQWQPNFAHLYGLPTDNQYIPLGTDFIKFPTIRKIKLTLEAGGRPDPIPPVILGEVRRDMPYFALRIDCAYEGSRNVEIDIPGSNPTVTLPDPTYLVARFYLAAWSAGRLSYYVEVESPLLDALDFDVSYPSPSSGIETINVKQEVKKALENALYQLQYAPPGPDGKPAMPRRALDALGRWLVGRYEIIGTAYDRGTAEMVFTYVGRQRPPRRPRQTGDGRGDVLGPRATLLDAIGAQLPPPPAWPRLFDTPYEMPLPPESGPKYLPPHDAGALNKIDHIVVLMQENRSFDQVFGYLTRDGRVPRSALLSRNPQTQREAPIAQDVLDGLLPDPNERDAIRYPDQPNSPIYRSQRANTSAWPGFEVDNPCHGHECVERQIANDMKGFIADYARKPGIGPAQYPLVMNYMTDVELPVFGALAREFAICDRWHCSHIGGTLPNRFINLTGDLSEDVYGSPEVENPHLGDEFAPLETTTFLDHLSDQNVSWTLFEHNYSTLRMFRKYTFDESRIVGFNDPQRGFAAMCASDALPSVSFIEPDYIEAPGGNDDHAPADMINGQILVANIVKALIESGKWEKTLLIITYDEHGGFYDHAPLPFEITIGSGPTAVTRNIAPLSNGERRLGVRVPAIIVSPLIAATPDGEPRVDHTVYDHTTITATILRRFCSQRLPDMGPRTNEAADVRDLLTLDTPRTDFDTLKAELSAVALWPTVALRGVPPTVQRKPDPELEDFHALVAQATSITGRARR